MSVPIQETIERAWREVAAIDQALADGTIDQAGWHARMALIVVPAYLSGADQRAQSGFNGTAEDWRDARSLVASAMPRSGRFLDVGCANGLLMESVWTWSSELGMVVEPWGVDISPELAALARARLPQWADRLFDANAASWKPPVRFDAVRTGLEYVPHTAQPAFIAHLLAHAVMPNGRLLIGPYTEERDETRQEPSVEERVISWGFDVVGRLERPHQRDRRVIRRLIYIEAGA
jgi:2-polyprenyl-3-methyl-5-hydroxy-6-metoxy-1,4-benzoquinol methylase